MTLNKLKDSLVGLAIVLFFNGCNSLDISNLWNYDAELVWNDDNLATAYVTDLYGDIFKGWDTGADNTAEQQTGIPFMLSTITTSGSGYKRWNYTNIHLVNYKRHFHQSFHPVLKNNHHHEYLGTKVHPNKDLVHIV